MAPLYTRRANRVFRGALAGLALGARMTATPPPEHNWIGQPSFERLEPHDYGRAGPVSAPEEV